MNNQPNAHNRTLQAISMLINGFILCPLLQGFYIYLYSVSILFLVYVYAYLLRRNRLKTELLTRTLSRSLSSSRAWAKGLARPDTDTKSKFRKRMISLDVSNHHTGTFYLRLGVLGKENKMAHSLVSCAQRACIKIGFT